MVLFHNPTSCERARSRQDNVQFSDSCGRADLSCTLTSVALSGQRSAARPWRLRAAAGQVAKEPLGRPGRRRETDDLRGVLGSCGTQFIQRDGGPMPHLLVAELDRRSRMSRKSTPRETLPRGADSPRMTPKSLLCTPPYGWWPY